jgi:hypothetical protein
MTDIVERLRAEADEYIADDGALCREAADEIERLRKGIQDYLDGSAIPRPARKVDTCAHGKFGWEACEQCIDEYFQRVLAP